jgi:uncharacterized protein (DUF433 family)
MLETDRMLRQADRSAAVTRYKITHEPAVLGGKPCIRGMCITRRTIAEFVAERPDD